MKAILTLLILLTGSVCFGQTEPNKKGFWVKPVTDTIRFVCRTKVLSKADQPLYVVDGVIKEETNLNAINPNDIQSVEILKDKKAIDKYGDKAKNGVIIITMKCKQPTISSS